MRFSRFDVPVMASLVLAITFSGPLQAQTGTGNTELMTDLVLQMQQLQDEVRMLRGQLEEQAYLIENLQRRQRDQYLDLDQRINTLRAAGPAQTALPGGPPPTLSTDGTANAAQPAVAEDAPEVRAPIETQSAVTGLATPAAESRSVAASGSDKEAYDAVYNNLKEQRYADAAEGFRDFLQQFPDSEYADNAQYWLGESYYATKNYEVALEAFETLLVKFPQSAKAGDALLKIGYTHYGLKQWDQARAALSQVQEQYPDTKLSRLAASRLRSMQLEGHF